MSTLSYSPIPKEKPMGGAGLILPWDLGAERPLGQSRELPSRDPSRSDWRWGGKQQPVCFSKTKRQLSLAACASRRVAARVSSDSSVLGPGEMPDVQSSVLNR